MYICNTPIKYYGGFPPYPQYVGVCAPSPSRAPRVFRGDCGLSVLALLRPVRPRARSFWSFAHPPKARRGEVKSFFSFVAPIGRVSLRWRLFVFAAFFGLFPRLSGRGNAGGLGMAISPRPPHPLSPLLVPAVWGGRARPSPLVWSCPRLAQLPYNYYITPV